MSELIPGGYALLDSGGMAKLERFGARIISRPSSQAVWKRQLGSVDWSAVDAKYDPDSGWRFKADSFEEWDAEILGIMIRLRLQRNGQVGLFPEHANYLPAVARDIAECAAADPGSSPRVLNLFAYTGMASVFCAKAGAQVTHVELQRSAIGWAEQNVAINTIPGDRMRYIEDDAVKFVSREVARGARYDIVIADPPSFSRISKNKEWQLDETLPGLASECVKLVQPTSAGGKLGAVYFTCHHPAFGAQTIMNLFRDACDSHGGVLLAEGQINSVQIEPLDLNIPEQDGQRKLPAGQGATIRGIAKS